MSFIWNLICFNQCGGYNIGLKSKGGVNCNCTRLTMKDKEKLIQESLEPGFDRKKCGLEDQRYKGFK